MANFLGRLLACLVMSTQVSFALTEQERLRRGEVVTTLKKQADSKYDLAVSKGVIEAPLDQVFTILVDFEHYEAFIPRVVESTVLKTEGNVVLYRSHINMPWPIADIFYECRATLFPEKNYFTFALVPGTGKGIKNFQGQWTFETFEGDPKRTLATYTLNYEPEVSYPAWVVRIGSKNTIEKNIVAVRKRVDQLEKARAK